MADSDKSLYSLRYNQVTSNLEAFGGGSPQWTLVVLNNVDPQQVPITRQINTTAPLQGGGNLTTDRTFSIPQSNGSTDGYLSGADWTTFNNKQPAGDYITGLTGDATATGPGSVPLTLATVNGNVGTFNYASITVNAKGLITSASSGVFGSLTDVGTDGIIITGGTGAVVGAGTSIAQHVADSTHNGYLSQTDWSTFNNKLTSVLANTNIFVGNGSNVATAVAVSGDATLANTGALTLATVNSNVGSFTHASITVDAKGRITAASSGTDTGITQLTGDVTAGPGSGSQAATLATVNGNVGSFTYSSITVNAKGLITAASSGTAPVTSVSGTTNQITSTGGTTPVLALASPLTTPGAVTVSGNLTFSPTTNGIVGNTTGNSTSAGNVGEIISAERQRGSELALTTATAANVCSLSLTPGQWQIVASIGYDYDATTSNSGNAYSISTTSATLTNANTTMATPDSTGQQRGEHDYTAVVHGNTSKMYAPLVSPAFVTTTTTYYLVALSSFTVANVNVFGSLKATRIR